jgi:hypothetical protein
MQISKSPIISGYVFQDSYFVVYIVYGNEKMKKGGMLCPVHKYLWKVQQGT